MLTEVVPYCVIAFLTQNLHFLREKEKRPELKGTV
jgi:hypothetical protein